MEGLYETRRTPPLLADGREVLVVEGAEGDPDVWHYLDPVTLAQRQGERVAGALAAHVGLPTEAVLVRVVPRQTAPGGIERTAKGYDAPGDQVRILATAIDWAEPPVKPVRGTSAPKPEPEPDDEADPDQSHRRRILEKPPEEIS